MQENENIYIVTDGCMWEQNKKNGTFYPHGIEVVNIETGQTQIIVSGSKITFVEGKITSTRTQEAYNEANIPVPSERKDKLPRAKSKGGSNKKDKSTNKNKSI
jgi:hypothetical protein